MTLERAAVIFNGTYTIKRKTTGEHRTFRIETQDEKAKFAPKQRIVSLLSGPDNTRDYEGFGFVTDQGINVWNKKRQRGPDNKPTAHEWFAVMLWDLAANNGARFGATHELQLAGTCLRCNRPLTTPESIERGIGPICAGMA